MSIISKEKIEKLSLEELRAYIGEVKKQMIWRENQPYVKSHGLGDGYDLWKEILKVCEQVLKEKQMPSSARVKFNDRNFLLAIDRAGDDIEKLFAFMVKIIKGQVEPTREIIKPLKEFSTLLQYSAKKFPPLVNQINDTLKKGNKND